MPHTVLWVLGTPLPCCLKHWALGKGRHFYFRSYLSLQNAASIGQVLDLLCAQVEFADVVLLNKVDLLPGGPAAGAGGAASGAAGGCRDTGVHPPDTPQDPGPRDAAASLGAGAGAGHGAPWPPTGPTDSPGASGLSPPRPPAGYPGSPGSRWAAVQRAVQGVAPGAHLVTTVHCDCALAEVLDTGRWADSTRPALLLV